jgi:hypothetical protein
MATGTEIRAYQRKVEGGKTKEQIPGRQKAGFS